MLVSLAVSAARADRDDTRFLREQTQRATEQKAQAQEPPLPQAGTLQYQGQVYQVPDRLDSLEAAIYIAINSSQWGQLPSFMARYRLLPGHRPALAAMAQGLLARYQGDYPLALRAMQQASEQEPQDARIRLELARLWFENHQDRQATEGFAQVLEAGLPAQVQTLVQQYRQALDGRAQWQGSAALGLGHNDNINQGNGQTTCLQYLADYCVFDRQMPAALGSGLLSYELALQRRVNLGANHNLLIRPMSYGQYYPRNNPADSASIRDYSNHLAQLQLGYQYLDIRNSVSLAPYVEHYYRNRHSDYLAQGLQLEWRHGLNRQWQLGSNLDAKRYNYSAKGPGSGADYRQYQWGLFASYSPNNSTSLYGGLDLTRKRHAVAQASSKDWALRGGVYHDFAGNAGIFVNATAIYRHSRNDGFDGFLGARRHDQQQVYLLNMGAIGWSFAGLTPELRLRHSVNRSNLNWAFGYRQTELSQIWRRSF
ncbi:hypothetical protein HNP55_003830 [Paucibacter oligotrophus]|uniref:Tetratricopeptide repeat protein n=1 Tax=Roseateles oligotrophus TaxID=1769250 RepID=A0A840LF62_9BURK|nr:porin family protein [Roseateles oligotrophus]MBB4845283.1 hypothetical protein [Roseateles oligotrophus]